MHHKTNVTSNSGSTQFASQRRHRLIPIVGTLALLWLTAGTAQATSVDLIFLPTGSKTTAGGSSTTDTLSATPCSGDQGEKLGTVVNGVCNDLVVGDTLVFGVQFQVDAAGVNAWSVDLGWDSSLTDVLTYEGANTVTTFYRGFNNPSPPPAIIGYTVQAIPFSPPAPGDPNPQQSSATEPGYVYGVSGGLTQDFGLTIANTSFMGSTVTFTVADPDAGANLGLGFIRTDGASMGNSNSQFIIPNFGSFRIGAAHTKRGDFNGDGIADVLIQSDSGMLYVFITAPGGGVNDALSDEMAQLHLDWVVEDVADVNGDAQADIILQYTGADPDLQGLIYVYITTTQDGSQAVSVATGATGSGMAGNVPTDWKLASVGDANGDGLADFYLTATATDSGVDTRYCQGAVYVYLSKATFPFFNDGGVPYASTSGSVDTCTNSDFWELVSVGDLDGDGGTDAVLRASASSGVEGRLYFAISGETGLTWTGSGAALSMPAAGWSVVGLGFDANENSSDFVIAEDATNNVFVYRTNALGNGYADPGNSGCGGDLSCAPFDIPADYRLRGLDDYNGDGVYDFLLEQTSVCGADPGGNSCQVIIYVTDPDAAPAITSSVFYASLNNANWFLPTFQGYSAKSPATP